jgi:IS30 family transposase
MVVALPDGNTADAVAAALIDHMGRLPTRLRRSLTWDRGCEMVRHAVITTALSMPVFFCDPAPPLAARHAREHCCADTCTRTPTCPRSPRTSSTSSPRKLNHRPRRVLDWATPAEAFGTIEPKPLQLAPA